MDELEIGTRVEIGQGEHKGRRGEIVSIRSNPMSSVGGFKRYTVLLDPSGQKTKRKIGGLGAALLRVID